MDVAHNSETQELCPRRPSQNNGESALANIHRSAARDVPVYVRTARRFTDRVIVDGQINREITGNGELGPRRDSDLATAVDGAGLDGDVVAVLEEDGVVPIISEVDIRNNGTATLRHAEDAPATAARDDLVNEDIGRVGSVWKLSVVVGHAERRVTRALGDVIAIDEPDPCVRRRLQQKAALADIARYYLVDGETVNIPRLNGVASRAANSDHSHLHVFVSGRVAFEADAETAAEVHCNGSQHQVLGAVEAQAKVWVTR